MLTTLPDASQNQITLNKMSIDTLNFYYLAQQSIFITRTLFKVRTTHYGVPPLPTIIAD